MNFYKKIFLVAWLFIVGSLFPMKEERDAKKDLTKEDLKMMHSLLHNMPNMGLDLLVRYHLKGDDTFNYQAYQESARKRREKELEEAARNKGSMGGMIGKMIYL